MKTWLIIGKDGCRALSRDRRGTKLPTRLGPWQLLSAASFDHTADASLTALRSIQAKGYFVLGYADPELEVYPKTQGKVARRKATSLAAKMRLPH